MSVHEYVSTACLHGLHDECRRTCKFCPAACSCPHHARFEAGRTYRPEGPGYGGQLAHVLAVSEEWAIGWWEDGDPWRRRHDQRGDWAEARKSVSAVELSKEDEDE